MRVFFLGLSLSHLEKSNFLYADLISEFNDRGHEIVVISEAISRDQTGVQIEKGIKVIRVPAYGLWSRNKIIKGIANLILPLEYKRTFKKSGVDPKFDLVLMPTPPITLINFADWFKKRYGSKVYLILRDIFPQNAIDLGLMKKVSPIYKYFRKLEKKTYKVADLIGCMSQGNIDYVLKHNPEVNTDKLHLLPNWGSLKPFISEEEKDKIRKKYGLTNKFVANFGGNLGKPQRIDNLLALAKSCKENKEILFLFIGSGTESVHLRKSIEKYNLLNVKFIDKRLDSDSYFKILQACDVGLVSLSQDFTIPNIPSKTLAYFNAKKPILASIDQHTDYHKILEDSETGLWARAGDTCHLKTQLLTLLKDSKLCEKMGENGYVHHQKYYLTTNAYSTIMSKL